MARAPRALFAPFGALFRVSSNQILKDLQPWHSAFAPATLISLRPASSDAEIGGARQANPVEVHGAYTPITKQLWSERRVWSADALASAAPPAQLTPKPPQRVVVTYCFKDDFALQEQYRNPWGFLRVGRLLEDADALAGNIAFVHCDSDDPAARPPSLVTASVDAIHVKGSMPITSNLTLGGRVVWTGRSSLDICMEMHEEGVEEAHMLAIFTFVAVDPVTRRSTKVNPLMPQSARDRQMYKERQQVADARKAMRSSTNVGLLQESSACRTLIERLVAEATTLRELPALATRDAVLMQATQLANTFTCQPQQRNTAGRIFGGFLMRRAYELGWATAYMFVGCRPTFVEADEITFKRPVDVGDLVGLRSKVLYAAPKRNEPHKASIHVQVVATVTKPERVMSDITNTFAFIFEAPMEDICGGLKRVLPSNSEEAHLVLQYYRD